MILWTRTGRSKLSHSSVISMPERLSTRSASDRLTFCYSICSDCSRCDGEGCLRVTKASYKMTVLSQAIYSANTPLLLPRSQRTQCLRHQVPRAVLCRASSWLKQVEIPPL